METDLKRRQVTLDQLNALVGFLKEHKKLANGLMRGRQGKVVTLKYWNLCAKKLNDFKEGAFKDGKGWSKYWCDWKYRVRRRALELKAAKDSNRSLPDGITALSPIEESVLNIIGVNTLEGVVIKCDPLGEQETYQETNNEDHNYGQFHHSSVPEPRHIKSRKRSYSSRDNSDLMDMDSQAGLSTPPERKPKLHAENAEDLDDDNATQFLELERQKLDTSKSIRDSLQTIASEITRLTDVMTHIKDILISRVNT